MSVLIDAIKDKVKNNDKNHVIAVVGLPGEGKSSVAISLACALSPNRFTKENIIIEDVEKLLEIINEPGKLKPGDVIVFDEGEQKADNREWWSKWNRALYKTLQMWRYRRIILITTATSFENLDKKVKKLVNMVVMPCAILKTKKRVKSKVYNQFPNPVSGKIYVKYPYYNGRFIKSITTSFPPRALWDWYVKASHKEKDSLTLQQLESLKPNKKKKKTKRDILEETVTEVSNNRKEYINPKNGKINRELIQAKLGVTQSIAIAAVCEIQSKRRSKRGKKEV